MEPQGPLQNVHLFSRFFLDVICFQPSTSRRPSEIWRVFVFVKKYHIMWEHLSAEPWCGDLAIFKLNSQFPLTLK